MSNKRGGGESPILRQIFNMRASGIAHSQIIETIDGRESALKKSREVGKDSELNALRALRQLWYVTEVTQIGKRDFNHDHQSHDLKVILDAISCLSILDIGLQIPNNFVFVEVKSSDVGIAKYQYRTIRDMDLKGTSEYESLMLKKKTIVLNGQMPFEDIQTNFLEHLICINNAWANQNT